MAAEFVDTNILVYAYDRTAENKFDRARELIEKLLDRQAQGRDAQAATTAEIGIAHTRSHERAGRGGIACGTRHLLVG